MRFAHRMQKQMELAMNEIMDSTKVFFVDEVNNKSESKMIFVSASSRMYHQISRFQDEMCGPWKIYSICEDNSKDVKRSFDELIEISKSQRQHL